MWSLLLAGGWPPGSMHARNLRLNLDVAPRFRCPRFCYSRLRDAVLGPDASRLPLPGRVGRQLERGRQLPSGGARRFQTAPAPMSAAAASLEPAAPRTDLASVAALSATLGEWDGGLVSAGILRDQRVRASCAMPGADLACAVASARVAGRVRSFRTARGRLYGNARARCAMCDVWC